MPASVQSPAPVAADGVQSVERALEIMQVLAFNNAMAGMRFSDLMSQTGLAKGTLHRLLKTLAAKGFVERDRDTRLYFLGFQFLALGARAANRMDLQVLARPALERLVKLTNDTAYLLVRSGPDSVCLDREEGSFPVKAMTQTVGTRRPLGKGAGPTAILAALRDDEVADVLRQSRSRLQEYPPVDVTPIRAAIAETRRLGYAVSLGGVHSGLHGVGVAILGPQNEPIGALTVSAIAERMDPARCRQVAQWLKRESARITERLGGAVAPPQGELSQRD